MAASACVRQTDLGCTLNSVSSQAVVGYTRVSTTEQGDSGLGLAAQRTAITVECQRRGWMLAEVFEDAGASGKSLNGRPALTAALDAIRTGAAGGLVVAKLDRLSRSLLDFAGLMDRSRTEGWLLVALDLGVDTSTPSGEMIASVMATFAQFERRLIGQRTKDALAVKKSQGYRLGRPSGIPPLVLAEIEAMRASGSSWRTIAADLNSRRVPTSQGGKRWYASTVQQAVLRDRTDDATRA